LADRLLALGVRPETCVALLAERSPDLVVALLAILKSGAAYAPLDPELPAERLVFLLEDLKPPVVLVQEGLLPRLPACDAAVARIEEEGLLPSGPPPARPPGLSDSLAYVLYTSGSTGHPKPVGVTHAALAEHVCAAADLLGLSERDRALSFASPAFDVSLEQILTALVRGAAVVLRGRELWPPADFSRIAGELGLTVAELPTAYWRQWVREPSSSAPPALRLVTAGGEAMPPEEARLWLRSPLAGVRLLNAYGPTEGVITATFLEVEAASASRPRAVALGRPLPGRRACVVDLYGQLQPVGAAGELCLGGGPLARGYLGRPDLTAERFVPDSGSPEPGGRLYRTGDLARRLPDGTLEYLGRLDRQVKVRGVRIEPGEIEAALLRHPAVREAAVDLQPGPAGEPVLAAWVAGSSPIPDLRAHLRRLLPEALIPAVFVTLPALPLTTGGKVDRKAMAERFRSQGLQPKRQEPGGASTPFEDLLAGIWSEVLRRGRVLPGDDFFELGGHSLLATQVVSRVRKVFGVELPLQALFEEPTLAGLARRVEASTRQEGSAAAPPIVPVPRDRDLPLSFAQQRLWFLDRLSPEAGVYKMFRSLRLAEPLDVAALGGALSEVVCRHESLRTCFPMVDGTPVQRIAEAAPVALPVVDLSGLLPEVRSAELRRLARAESGRRFDLERGPLLRAVLVRSDPEVHALLLSGHHTVCDGWSTGILMQELGTCHRALSQGEAADLPELPIQYGDFAVWQRRWLQGETLEQELSYWRHQLAGMPELLELPTDRPRPAVQSFRCGQVELALPADLAGALAGFGRQAGSTLFMTLLAGVDALLHRYTGQEAIAVGSPIANRRYAELESLIGNFANTLVLGARMEGTLPFRDLLERVREAALGAYAHQDLPFESLVEALSPRRDLAHNPIFQVLFGLHNLPRSDSPSSGLEMWPLVREDAVARLDLALDLVESPEGLRGAFEYASDLFDRATVARLAGHLQMLLSGALAEPDRRIAELPLLSGPERQQLLEWNDSLSEGVSADCLHERFELWASRRPEAVAVVCGAERLTYGELDRRAGAMAWRLRNLGVGPETPVGVYLERSVELVAALLGVLKAGGAYVPLDPASPQQRAAWILESARVQVVVTRRALAQQLSGLRVSLVDLDEEVPTPPASPVSGVSPEHTAYVIFTSGSTGRPKGVQVAHGSVVHLLETARPRFGFGAQDVWTVVHSYAFDFSVWEIWGALALGGRLVVVPLDVARSPVELAGLLSSEAVTVLNQTPSALRHLAENVDRLPASLRLIVCGGEALPLELVPRLLDWGVPVWSFYGPTEATVWAAAGPVLALEERRQGTMPLGRPLPDARLLVLGPGLEPLPVGVAGELCLGGPGLARGYFREPALTAAAYVPDPFADEPGERLYRTGDRARCLGDGTLEFLGRIDQQVKLRGVRIEPGEVEAALVAYPGVREAVVSLRGSRLVAWWAGDPAAAPELRHHLRQRLPEAMVPSLFHRLDALPLTPHGKVDRRALPDPVPAAEEDGAPLGPIEETVAEVWSGLLGIGKIGRHRGFFELGGHSLLATRVMARVNQAFQTDLPLRALFEAPTVAGLALLVASAGRDQLPMPAFRRVPRGQPLAPSFAQERLWVMDRLIPDSPVYNVFQALDLSGPLDETALERAFVEVTRQHETLRTRFAIVQGKPMQVVEPLRPRPLPVVDLRALPPRVRQEEADRLVWEEARRPFDLLRGPLLRFGLLRLGEASRLLLNLHHIICDGWSLDLLAREVGALYRGQPLAELPFQYADYADWQRRWPAELLDGQLAWWKERLAGLATLEIPTDFPRPPVQTFRGGLVLATLPPDLSVRLCKLARERHATLFMLLLAGWQALLHRIAGQEDVVVGAPVANRNWPEIEGLVGFFANNLVIRVDLSQEPRFVEALERVREAALSAFSRQDLPFERLVAELAPERDLSRAPVFQVAFSFQEALPPLDLGSGVRGQLLAAHTGTSKFDLGLQVDQEGEGWVLQAEYAADLFDAATVRRWLAHLRVLLEGIAASPEARISELPLLSRAERHHLLLEWNDTGRGRPPKATIHQLVEEQAARTPDAVAVLFGDERLTYAELNVRADGLADRLLALGVRPEVCVGLLAERSPEMIVALLAILKAGAAYAPLDPELPAERLAFLLDDLRPPVVLAQGHLLPRLPACAAAVARLEDDGPLPAGPRKARPAVPADSPAYVLYTSGSTGRPKGVTAVHRGVVRLVREGGFADLGPSRTLLQLAPLSFDASTLEIWGALANGGRLVVFPPGVPSFEALGETIARHGVDTLWLTAALFHQVVDEKPSTLLPVHQLLAGGDVLSPPHVRKALELRPGGMVINGYGPTESTTFACSHTMRSVEGVGEPVSLGRPIGGTRVYVLDRNLQPVPVGVPGELFIGGDGLARGYHRQPDLTAERFLPDSLDPGPGGRLYRTGDLARWLPDGNLQFLGRIDRQVKIRGIRIELEEIETVLRRHPGVREAVVLAREDRPNDRRLVAYYVPEQEQEPSSDQLRAWLRGKLPEPMVPAAFVSLESMPLTQSGKIDRRALPVPAAEPVQSGEVPRTPLESLVAGVFAEILGAAEVPRDVSFFDLGGNSLLATQVVTLLQEILPVELNLRKVFEGPTVARLAQLLEEECGALAAPERLAMGEILAEYERLTDQSSRSVIMGSNLAARRAGR
jgi:amino acid adenylation domain-containing protein